MVVVLALGVYIIAPSYAQEVTQAPTPTSANEEPTPTIGQIGETSEVPPTPTPLQLATPTPHTVVAPFELPVDAEISFAPTQMPPTPTATPTIFDEVPEVTDEPEVIPGISEEPTPTVQIESTPTPTPLEESEESEPEELPFLVRLRDVFVEFIETLIDAIPNPFSKRKAKLTMLRDELQSKDVIELEATGTLDDLVFELTDSEGKTFRLAKRLVKRNRTQILELLKPRDFYPGQFHLKVTQNDEVILEQDFTWGVLAINTNKSIYMPEETAAIHLAVLDEEGMMVCDAALELKISNTELGIEDVLSTTDGEIQVNPECELHAYTVNPDYETEYQVAGVGEYEMELRAQTQNGEFVVTDAFEVRESVPFDIDRVSATRLYPPATYEMAQYVKVNRDFRGVIEEPVPQVFDISNVQAERLNTRTVVFDGDGSESQTLDFDDTQLEKIEFVSRGEYKVIRWHVDLFEGDIFKFSYNYKAPNESPQYYLLGPSSWYLTEEAVEEVKPEFEELRSWQLAADAVGDFAIFRESTATEAITTTQQTMDWIADVATNANITIDGGTRTLVDLSEGGHYLVMYNLSFESTNGTNARAEIQSWIDLAGTNLQYGRATCYVRNSGNANECYTAGAAIINASAGDDVSIEVQRTDTGGVTVQRIANESGIMVMKLDDTWDYARIHENTGGQTLNNSGGFDSITWDDNSDELDSGSFSHSTGTDPEEITLVRAGHYLVAVNVMNRSSSTSTRYNRDMRLTLGDGTTQTEIDGTRVTAYPRGSNSSQDHVTAYVGIINATANDVLEVQVGCIRNEAACANVTNVGNETAISIVKLPDTADYIRLHTTATADIDNATETEIVWQTAGEDEVDAGSFSHSTDSTQIDIDQNGDYLFTASHYADRSADTNGTRAVPHWEWDTNDSGALQYGGFGKFNRGNQSTTGTFTSGGSGGIIIDGLTSTDYVELVNTEEANGGTNTDGLFQANRSAVQGVHIGSLFAAAAELHQYHYHWRNDDGTESGASSATSGSEDTVLTDQQKSSGIRLRMTVSNEGGSTSGSVQYRLEYGERSTTCGAIGTWTDVGAVGGHWDMFNSSNITDGNNTTNIAESTGGVTDENTTFVTSNAAVKDTSSQTAGITLTSTQYVDMEYSIQALAAATDGGTYCFRMTDAGTPLDVYDAYPEITMATADLDQIHYHWRNDDGSESAATSATSGVDDTELLNVAELTGTRLRIQVSNEGGVASASTQYRLEYGVLSSACSSVSTWVDVGAVGGDWDMFNSTNLTDGNDTTNIAEGIGGMPDENTTFETPNAAVKDTSSQTAGITLSNSDFVEIEYSIQALAAAPAGEQYCFRLTDAGTALDTYTRYPRARLIPPGTWAAGEVGSGSTDNAGTTINLNKTYENPIVIVEPIEGDSTGPASNDPAAALITSISSTSFDVRIQEPDNEADDHGTEGFYYMVMEEGAWEFADGNLVNVGSLSVADFWGNGTAPDTEADCNFTNTDFTAVPAVLTSLQTDNNTGTPDFLTVRTTDVSATTDDFDCAMEVPDAETNTPSSNETVGWVAIDTGTGRNNNINFEVGRTAQSVQGWTNTWFTQNFAQTFSSAPLVVGSKQTVGGGDGGWMRYDNITTTNFQVANDERDDGERSHTGSEIFGYFAFESAGDVLVISEYEQLAYRWFANDNSTDVGSPLAAQDTSATLTSDGEAFRLRMLIHQDQYGAARYGNDFKLQFAEESGTCDTSFTGETYADVTASSLISFNDNSPADGAALTSNANDPTSGNTIRDQTYEELNNVSNDIVAIGTNEDGLYDFALVDNDAPVSTTYCFRVVNGDGAVLDTYTQMPEITTAPFHVSGTVYLADETTVATTGNGGPCDGSTSNVTVRVNGGTAFTGTCSSSDATYQISGMGIPTAGDTVTVYQTDASDKANTILVTDAGQSDQGVDLALDTVIIRDDQGSDATILDLLDYDNDENAADMLFDADDASPDTLSTESNVELHIWTGDTFDPGGDVDTSGASGNLHIDDNAIMEIDTVTSTIAGDVEVNGGATWRVNADAQVDGGDITTSGTSAVVTTTAGTPTVTLTSTGSIGGGTTPSITFYNLGTSGSGITTIADAVTTNNDVAVGVGTTLRINANLTVNGGDLTTTTTAIIDTTSGSPTTFLNGTGTLGGGSGAINFYNLDIGDGTTDTTTVSSDFSINDDLTLSANQTVNIASSDITIGSSGVSNSGRVIVGSGANLNQTGGTTTVQSSDGALFPLLGGSGTTTFYNLDVGPSSVDNFTYTFSTNGAITVSNVLTIQDAGGSDVHTFDVDSNDDPVTVGSIVIDANATYTAGSNTANPLTVSDDFTNNGTFTHSSGRVVFDDNSNVSTLLYAADTTFGELRSTVAGKAIEFDNVDQTNVVGDLTLTGTNCGVDRIFLDSDVNDSQWDVNSTGTETLDYLDVEDSNAIAALLAVNSTEDDFGSNTSWTVDRGLCGTIALSISDNSIGYGNLESSTDRYATGDILGSGTEVEAHTVSASSNAPGGYILSINGQTLTSDIGPFEVTAIGGANTASAPGTEQFGLRMDVSSGTGTVTAPYDGSGFAYDAESVFDQVASGQGDNVVTTYSVRYVGNITSSTEASGYDSVVTYTATATF